MEIVSGRLDKLIHNSRLVCGFLTLNEMHIELTSLIICSVKDNLANMPSTPPPELKKTLLYIVHLIILCISTETSIFWKINPGNDIFGFIQILKLCC